jgi:4-amino-4-deoxy-L-arabinose transferase-like glycosyltransferase
VPHASALGRALLLLAIGYGLTLPLRDVLAYPDRISVLPNLQTDAEAYYNIGRAIAEQRTLDAFPIRHPPVWIGLLALAFSLTGPSFVVGKLILWAALILSVAGCGWLARRMYGPTAGWIAALLCAWSPALRGYVGTVQYEVFTGALLIAVVMLAVRAIESSSDRARWQWALWVGLAGGILVLTRETFAVVVPLIGLWVATRLRAHTTRRTAASLAIGIAGMALAPAFLWSAMQSVRYGSLVTISEKGPIVIELGHNTRANGSYNAPLVGIGPPTGLSFAMQHPGREAVLSVRKMLYFWGVLRDGWNVPRPSAVWLWRATTGLVPLEVFGALARGGWLLACFVVAIWMLGPEGRIRWWGVPAVVLLLMGVHVITLSSHRFAVPALPLVFVLVSGPLSRAAVRLKGIFRSRAVVAACALLLAVGTAMQFQSWPLDLRFSAADLDGLSADNVPDDVARRTVRSADAARGVRPVALVTDFYFARGTIRLTANVRRLSEPRDAAAPALQLSLVDLDGVVVCATEAIGGELPTDRFAPTTSLCRLSRDAVATVAIVSLGTVDFALDEVSLQWVR